MCVCVCVCVCEMKVLVAQSYPNFCDPMDYNPPGFSVHGDFSGRNTSRYSFPSLGDLPDPGIGARSPALQVDSLWSEPPGKLPQASIGTINENHVQSTQISLSL